MEDKIKVLFLGTGDGARCEMAEGFLRNLAGDRFIAVSASTEHTDTQAQTGEAQANPTQTAAPQIEPLAVEVMRQVGIDISQQHTKPVAEVFKEHFAYVVGVCDMQKERCPVFPFTYELLKWSIEDPAAVDSDREPMASFRRVRDSIRDKIREFIAGATANLKAKTAAAGGSR